MACKMTKHGPRCTVRSNDGHYSFITIIAADEGQSSKHQFTNNAPKLTISQSKNFLGRGLAPSPNPYPSGEGTPLPTSHPLGASILAPSALGHPPLLFFLIRAQCSIHSQITSNLKTSLEMNSLFSIHVVLHATSITILVMCSKFKCHVMLLTFYLQ